MSIDFFTELSQLEDKVGALVSSLAELRAENAALKENSMGSETLRDENESLKEENDRLQTQVEELKADNEVEREKVDMAAQRVKTLLSKLEKAT